LYRDLLNLIYGWELENLNTRIPNAKYIDLLDKKNQKAIQITSQNDSEKIKKTIKGFFDTHCNQGFELKVLLIAKRKKDYRTDFTFNGKYKFDAKKDVIDIEDILKEIKNKDLSLIQQISEFLTKEFGASEKLKHLPFNKIPEPKGFIGRRDDLSQLQAAKDSGKTSFVLHGAGGVGKTDLALEFIKLNKLDYKENIFIDMQGLSDNPLLPKDAMLKVIHTFEPGVPANLDEHSIKNLYNSLLNQSKTIILFDNAKDQAQVESLNNSAVLILVTSRTNFNVKGGFSKEIGQMLPDDAHELLYSIADKQRFDGQANELAHLAGYLPMALLPMASLLAEDVTLEAKDLVQIYSNHKNTLLLADSNRENLSVEASFDLSYELLNNEARESWRKLAVFPADFDLEAMQTIWEKEDGKEIHSILVKKHLIEFNQETKRSRLHDLARAYANKKVKIPPPEAVALFDAP
jgi:hypothetical protein